MDAIHSRLRDLSRDGALDVEDVDLAVDAALADGVITPAEVDSFRAALLLFSGMLEPGARAFLDAHGRGERPRVPNRVLLAPHPPGEAPDRYYPRVDVVALQEALTALGFVATVDGRYGPGTASAVSAFQRVAGLPVTGVVDSRTLDALNGRLLAAGRPAVDVNLRDRIRPDQVLALRHGPDAVVNRALEEALVRLAAHYRQPAWHTAVDGRFDEDTERALTAFQEAAFLPRTGILDRSTRDALNEALRLAGLAPLVADTPATLDGVELHFYPGDAERKVYVLRRGEVLDRYAMVGGERFARPDPRNPQVGYDPTPAGSYEVVELSPHASNAWAASYVPYGSRLREVGGEIEFQDGTGRWQRATGPGGVFAGRTPPPLGRQAYLHSDGTVMATWILNDFGHLRARLRDLRTGVLQGHMIHASPHNELTPRYHTDTRAWLDASVALAELRYSHGCEHIHPRDLDQMVARGYLAPGTRFVVHGYDARFTGRIVS